MDDFHFFFVFLLLFLFIYYLFIIFAVQIISELCLLNFNDTIFAPGFVQQVMDNYVFFQYRRLAANQRASTIC